MLTQPRIKVARYAAVMRFLVNSPYDDVNVLESVHQTARSEKKAGLPSRSLLECERRFKMARLRFAPAWQPSLLRSAPKAKTGGKGIRTPDFQLAKLALYQLSYAPLRS